MTFEPVSDIFWCGQKSLGGGFTILAPNPQLPYLRPVAAAKLLRPGQYCHETPDGFGDNERSVLDTDDDIPAHNGYAICERQSIASRRLSHVIIFRQSAG